VISCLDSALRLVDELPDTADRARNELRLRQLYTTVLSQTTGYTAGTLLQNLARTRALCEQLGDAGALFDALSALYLLHANSGRVALAQEVEPELFRLSKRLGASAALQHHFLRGAMAVWLGHLADAESHLTKALRSSVSLEEADRPYGANPLVAARSFEGLRRWATGDAAAARVIQKEAVALAEQQGRPFT